MEYIICYISNVSASLDKTKLDKLMNAWKIKNAKRNINGILLYSEGNFFQVMEGAKKDVLGLWDKIRNDPRHYGLIQILGRDLERGCFNKFEADVLNEGLMPEQIETIQSLPCEYQKVIKTMLRNFVQNRYRKD